MKFAPEYFQNCNRRRAIQFVGSGLASAALCSLAAAQAPTYFDDVSSVTGTAFQHEDGAFGYAMGGGSAWIDIDGDGDEDLFAASTEGRHAMFRYDGAGVFVDIATAAGFTPGASSEAIGALAFDYDADQDLDIFLSGTRENELWDNDGSGAFANVAPSLGLDSDAWSSCAATADWDKDGDLDLYVGNYVKILNFPYHFGWPNEMYINVGTATQPSYSEQAVALGVDDSSVFGAPNPDYPQFTPPPPGVATAGCTLSICTLDWDEDGDAELMVGNDFGQFVTPNKLYRNDIAPGQALAFTDISTSTGFEQRPHYNMGIVAADYDHDGDWDFYKSNLGDNVLLRNDGGVFSDETYNAGPIEGDSPDAPGLLLSSWGMVWQDLDNDGHEDLYVVNGLIPAASFIANDSRAQNGLHLNNGDGTFEEIADGVMGAADDGPGRGVAFGDFDRDGYLDLYVMNNGAIGVGEPEDRSRLFLNGSDAIEGSGNFVQLRLRARGANWQAIGARLEMISDDLLLKRQVLGDPVFVSSSSREVHFGLGQRNSFDRVDVEWPSGTFQRLVSLPANLQVGVLEPIVLVDALAAPTYDTVTQSLPLAVDVENTAAVAQPVSVLFQLVIESSGAVVTQSVANASVSANSIASVSTSFGAPLALFQAAQGIGLELRAYVYGDGAWDSRATTFPLQ